jgi:phytoene dehydrogenase-like protein
VVLDSAEEIPAHLVLSNADPHVTFLRLVEPADLEADFRQDIANLHMRGCSAKINLALDALLDSTAYPGGGVMDAPGHNAAQAVLADWRQRRLL